MTEPIYKNVRSTYVEPNGTWSLSDGGDWAWRGGPKGKPVEGDFRFYTYSQNNSGGSFDDSDNYGEYCIVAATSPDDANRRAEMLGLYFDGQGDCECCGNRWYEQSSYDKGTEVPEIYGKSVEAVLNEGDIFRSKVVVHYPDGSKRIIERIQEEP